MTESKSDSSEASTLKLSLSAADYARNICEGILKGVPCFGEALHQFIFGPCVELRMRRIELTLAEIGEHLRANRATPSVNSEQFVGLLEGMLPRIARATSEDVRQRFRDLLMNAATLPAANPGWHEAEIAGQLLCEVAAPGLAILSALGRCPEAAAVDFAKSPVPNVSLVSRPSPQLVAGEFDYANPGKIQSPIGYSWPLVEEWTHRLREKRLLHFHSVDGRGGFGQIYLAPLGQLVVKWAVGDSTRAVE